MVSRCFPGGYNVKLYISRGRLAWWLLAFLCCVLKLSLMEVIQLQDLIDYHDQIIDVLSERSCS